METSKPKKLYHTLIADPLGGYGAVNKCPLMDLDEIKNMPVSNLMEPDGHVWLGVASSLRCGFDVLEAWGTIPRSLFTYVKPIWGLGVTFEMPWSSKEAK